MTIQMIMAEAKTRLSSLVQKTLDGEDVTIARDGKPAVRVVAVDVGQKPKRKFGSLKATSGWTEETPCEVFAPDPADAMEGSLCPGERRNLGCPLLDIAIAQAECAVALPLTHRDPWDRRLAAQAIAEGMIVVTLDNGIAALGAQTPW